MSDQTSSRVRGRRAAAALAAHTLHLSLVLPHEDSQAVDSLPEPTTIAGCTEFAGAIGGEPIVAAAGMEIGSWRERSLTPMPGSSVPPSKRPKQRLSQEDDDDVEIIVLPLTADAYMRDSVPVFVENSAVCTPGPAPCTHVTSPHDDLVGVDKVYRRPSPGLERLPATNSDEQRIIRLMDSGLLQLFCAHHVDLDHRGTFCFMTFPVSFLWGDSALG